MRLAPALLAAVASLLLSACTSGPIDPLPIEPTTPTPSRIGPTTASDLPFEVLKRPLRPADTPPLEQKDKDRLPDQPKEWRWIANSPLGRIYAGVNQAGAICTLSEDGLGIQHYSCARWDPNAPNGFNASGRDSKDQHVWYWFFLIPDGYRTLAIDSLECNVRGNVVILVNIPQRKTTLTITGERTITSYIPARTDYSPTGAPFCA